MRMSGPHSRAGRVRNISPPTGIQTPDRQARCESLYRLSCLDLPEYKFTFFCGASTRFRVMASRNGASRSLSLATPPDNIQQSQGINIHVPGGIRTHNPSKRAAAHPRLKPRGHWGRHRFEPTIPASVRPHTHALNRAATGVGIDLNPRPQQASGLQAASLLRSWVQIPPGAWIFVCCECRVLSGRDLCDELITHPEESYRLCCVVVCDLETSRMGAPYIYMTLVT